MTPQLTPDQSVALHNHDNQPKQVVDPATSRVYVLVDQATHERAMDALRHRDDETSILRGINDLEAGRHSPADEAFARIDARFEATHDG